jgi:hypothetical protein
MDKPGVRPGSPLQRPPADKIRWLVIGNEINPKAISVEWILIHDWFGD